MSLQRLTHSVPFPLLLCVCRKPTNVKHKSSTNDFCANARVWCLSLTVEIFTKMLRPCSLTSAPATTAWVSVVVVVVVVLVGPSYMLAYLVGRLCSDNCTCCHTGREGADCVVSPSHSILTPGQPVPALTSHRQVPGRVATGVPDFRSQV